MSGKEKIIKSQVAFLTLQFRGIGGLFHSFDSLLSSFIFNQGKLSKTSFKSFLASLQSSTITISSGILVCIERDLIAFFKSSARLKTAIQIEIFI